jgi:hypothetical protein
LVWVIKAQGSRRKDKGERAEGSEARVRKAKREKAKGERISERQKVKGDLQKR